jgi:hypothetical protein
MTTPGLSEHKWPLKAYAPSDEVGGYWGSMPDGCGVDIFGDFAYRKDNEWISHTMKTPGRGVDFGIAAFIDNQVCRGAYEQLKEHYNIVYQSPVRVNANSGNLFFFCVYDTQT